MMFTEAAHATLPCWVPGIEEVSLPMLRFAALTIAVDASLESKLRLPVASLEVPVPCNVGGGVDVRGLGLGATTMSSYINASLVVVGFKASRDV